MDNSYKIWDRISKEEEVTLYQDCALVNISEYSKIDDYTKVLSMFNREHQVYSPEDFNGLYGSNLRYYLTLVKITEYKLVFNIKLRLLQIPV